jgi:WD40 repeat protein
MEKIFIILIAIILLFLSCWDRQSHEISAPIIPTYNLKSKIIDIDTRKFLPDIEVKLEASQLSDGSVDFKSQLVTSNESGEVTFENLYIGVYKLYFYRDRFLILQRGYFQNYGDSTLTIELPTPFCLSDSTDFAAIANVQEFENYRDSKFAFSPDSNLVLISTPFDGINMRLFVKDIGDGRWIQQQAFQNPVQFVEGGLVNDISFYPGDPKKFFVAFPYQNQLNLLSFGEGKPIVLDTLSLDNEPWAIYTWDRYLYLSNENSINIYDLETSQFVQQLYMEFTDINITTFLRDNNFFWITDINTGNLYKCNLQLETLRTYIPFNQDERIFITDMAMDNGGKFWINTK